MTCMTWRSIIERLLTSVGHGWIEWWPPMLRRWLHSSNSRWRPSERQSFEKKSSFDCRSSIFWSQTWVGSSWHFVSWVVSQEQEVFYPSALTRTGWLHWRTRSQTWKTSSHPRKVGTNRWWVGFHKSWCRVGESGSRVGKGSFDPCHCELQEL